MSVTTQAYDEGNKVIAGWVSTRTLDLAADVYYQGMPLEYNTTNNNYEYLSAGTIAAIYNGEDGRTLSSAGKGDCIVAGEVYEGGIVDDSGSQLTLDNDAVDAYRAAGFYVKPE